jgi:hypothetical protein
MKKRPARKARQDARRLTVLLDALKTRDAGRVRDVLDTGKAHLEDTDILGHTALHHVAWQCDEGLVTLLADLGADVNARDANDRTPLHAAAGTCGGAELTLAQDLTVLTLVRLGANPWAMDRSGLTPYGMMSGSLSRQVDRTARQVNPSTMRPAHTREM